MARSVQQSLFFSSTYRHNNSLRICKWPARLSHDAYKKVSENSRHILLGYRVEMFQHDYSLPTIKLEPTIN